MDNTGGAENVRAGPERSVPKKGYIGSWWFWWFPRVGSGTGGPPGGFWYWRGVNPEWLTPEWVLVLVLVVLVVVLVVLAVVSS